MYTTQRDKIIQLLESRDWVPMPEFIKLFITRGGAIICDLRKAGWAIISRRVAGKSYAEYKLLAKPKENIKLL